MKQRTDLFWATIGEGGIILVIAAISWAAKQPFIFASLGPTAYELVQQPQMRSARTYNVVVGHFIALAAGLLSLYLLNAWAAPVVTIAHFAAPGRVYAAVLGAGISTFGTLIARASQPAALSTTLLVTLGSMQTRRDAIAIIVGVLIIAAVGEPVRQLRLKQRQSAESIGEA